MIRNALRRLLASFRDDSLKKHISRGLVVGRNFNMRRDVIIDHSHSWLIEIGDDVTLAPRVHIIAHDASTKHWTGYTRIGRVRIGSRVFVGAGSILLPGVSIGDDAIVGAGSVVTKNVPPGSIVAGNPARPIGTTEAYIARCRTDMTNVPCYGEGYTLRGGVTAEMKERMKLDLLEANGYVE